MTATTVNTPFGQMSIEVTAKCVALTASTTNTHGDNHIVVNRVPLRGTFRAYHQDGTLTGQTRTVFHRVEGFASASDAASEKITATLSDLAGELLASGEFDAVIAGSAEQIKRERAAALRFKIAKLNSDLAAAQSELDELTAEPVTAA